MHLKTSSEKQRPFCLGLNMLIPYLSASDGTIVKMQNLVDGQAINLTDKKARLYSEM